MLLDEIQTGDPDAAARRLEIVEGLPILVAYANAELGRSTPIIVTPEELLEPSEGENHD